MPYWPSLAKKLRMRVIGFLREGELYVLVGVLIVNLLYTLGVIAFAAKIVGPLVTRILGLPAEAVGALLVGLLRKDVAVGMLAPLGLSLRQLIVASFVLTAYFPCVASFVMLLRELGAADMLKATVIMVTVTFTTGAVLNLLLTSLRI
jgi:ferrous iron transport protein B